MKKKPLKCAQAANFGAHFALIFYFFLWFLFIVIIFFSHSKFLSSFDYLTQLIRKMGFFAELNRCCKMRHVGRDPKGLLVRRRWICGFRICALSVLFSKCSTHYLAQKNCLLDISFSSISLLSFNHSFFLSFSLSLSLSFFLSFFLSLKGVGFAPSKFQFSMINVQTFAHTCHI